MAEYLARLRRWAALFRRQPLLPVWAANGAFFLMLAAVPTLVLGLRLLQFLSGGPERLTALLPLFLPEAFLPRAEALIARIRDNTSRTSLGISALTVLWSAGKGIGAVRTGLGGIFGQGHSRWLHSRLMGILWTLAFLAALPPLTGLLLLARTLPAQLPLPAFFRNAVGYGVLVLLQTGLFTLLYRFLPEKSLSFRQNLPGGALAAMGCTLFSGGFSLYLRCRLRWVGPSGSLYDGPLAMLWLYGCLWLFFRGAALNKARNEKNMENP